MWGGWLVVTAVTFSFMQGIIHPYYMVALAPAIAALAGVGAMSLWQPGLGWLGRSTAAAGVAGTAILAYILLDRTPAWQPWLRTFIVLAGVVAAAGILAQPLLRRAPEAVGQAGPTARPGLFRALALAPACLALIAGLAGPLAYTIQTVGTTYTGSLPSAGPATTGAFGNGGPGGQRGGAPAGGGFPGGTGTGAGAGAGTGGAGFPGGGTGTGTRAGAGTGAGAGFPGGVPGSPTGRTGGGGRIGGPGGLSGNTQVNSALVKLLSQDAAKYKWIAATEGTQAAAPIELATGGDAVLAIGGFNGTDPAPTLAQFEAMVARHEIHYYVGAGRSSFGGGTGSSAIESWVAAHFRSQTVGGTTVYDLTQEK
jgi:hypothetical protein